MRIPLIALLVCGSVFAAPELSLDWIHENIKQTTTLEGLLARFRPETLERHLLVYGSESQQFASPSAPRVIVYSPNADFIMAFNGTPDSAGYQELEILRFGKDWRFHPEVIHFDPAGTKPPTVDANPTICASCHQADVRPNWDPYFHWPGFYGSEDDDFDQNTTQIRSVSIGPEGEFYRQFQARKADEKRKNVGRYRFLPERHYAQRPNLDFNNVVTLLNTRRFLRIISEHPQAAQILPHVEAGIVKVDELPAALRKDAKRTLQEITDDTKAVMLKARRDRVARATRLTGAPPAERAQEFLDDSYWQQSNENELRVSASWRYVFEEIFHEPFRPISTSFRKDYRLNLLNQVSLMNLLQRTKVVRGRVILPQE